jgi:hypothetical protein
MIDFLFKKRLSWIDFINIVIIGQIGVYFGFWYGALSIIPIVIIADFIERKLYKKKTWRDL